MRLALLLVAAMAATAHADDPKIAFEKYKLPNGLEVILAPDNTVPIVAVNIRYHVGSGDEVPGKSGFAHLFEHMMFQGSKNTGADAHFKILRQIGATNVNGTTNTERTNYFEVVPSHNLETALWLESDRMGHLLDVLDSKEMANQIDVVRNERRQNYDNVPYRKANFALFEALFPEGHPYRHLTIGKHEDLEKASVDDVKKFFKTWYVPANATLVISGDFDPAEAKKLVEKWFGTYPASQKPTVVKIPVPLPAAKEVTVDDSFAKLRQITFAWISPAAYTDEDADMDFVADALTREGIGALYKSLVYDKQLAQSVRSNQDGMTFNGVFQVTVTLRRDADMATVKKIVADEVAKLTKTPLSDKALARVVAHNESVVIYGLEDVNGRAEGLQECNQYFGDPGCITADLDRYRKATPEKIRATAAKYLVPEHMVTVITNPTAAAGGDK
jgi:predicted Zn-dependent peptidase